VTGRVRIVLAWTAPCWLSALAVAAGFGPPAAVALLVALAVLTGAAFRPAFAGGLRTAFAGGLRTALAGGLRPVFAGGRGLRVSRARPLRLSRADLGRALLFGVVGSGQAALLVVVAFGGTATVSAGLVPPLIGVPLIELTLVWHQYRVAAARAVLSDRAAFDRRLAQISAGTAAVVALPVLAGAGIALAVWAGAHPPGGQRLASAILLTAVYAICLVLAAHRRVGTAATLVWWPVLLVLAVGSWTPALLHVVPRFADTLAAATLLGAGLPGLVVAALVLRDPESYR